MEFMNELPDNFADLAIVDPPYGINATKMPMYNKQRKTSQRLSKLNGGGGKLKNRALNTMNCDWDDSIPKDEYFNELFRVSKKQIIWGGNYFDLHPTRCILVWDKVQPWENFSQVEMAWTSFDSPAKLFKFDNRTGNKIHPTQKPIALYKWLLKNYAKPGDKILDTHLGSGSSRIAAFDGGFDFTGYEIDKEYFDASVKRFQNHISQLKLELV